MSEVVPVFYCVYSFSVDESYLDEIIAGLMDSGRGDEDLCIKLKSYRNQGPDLIKVKNLRSWHPGYEEAKPAEIKEATHG